MREPKDPTNWVYVIAKVENDKYVGPVKIGITGSPNSRLTTIQTACPFRVEMPYVFECPDREIARSIEKCFHDTQQEYRSHGEWFSLEPVVAIHMLCLAFRTLLRAWSSLGDDEIDQCLDRAGVLHAERKFGLLVPSVRH